MTLRDDMVFTPDLGPQHRAAAPTRAREERRIAAAQKRGGVLSKINTARSIRRRRAYSRRAKAGAKKVTLARRGAAGLARGASRLATRAVGGTPVGIAATVLILGALVAVRLATGRPFEGIGESMNRVLLGDLDDQARAKMETRHQLGGDKHIARMSGQSGVIGAQVTELAKDLNKLHLQHEIGSSLLRERFPVNNVFDMLILRAKEKILEAWEANDGVRKAKQLRALLSPSGAFMEAFNKYTIAGEFLGVR